MTKFFNTFKKPCFWPIFPIFGAKNILLENPALSRTTSCRILASRQNLEKTTDTIPRKRPDRQNDRRTDERTDRPYFIGPFWLMLGVQKHLGCLIGLGLTLWYIGFGLERYSDYLTGFGLILQYIWLGLENLLHYHTGFGLVLWYIGFGLEKH